MSTWYEFVTNSEGKIVRLDKVDTETFQVWKVHNTNGQPADDEWCQILNNKPISLFKGLEKKEPGDIKFLLKLLASIAQRQSGRL